MTGQDLRDSIQNIRGRMLKGIITYDQAEVEAKPIIEEMNRRGREIAKKYGRKFTGFKFSEVIR